MDNINDEEHGAKPSEAVELAEAQKTLGMAQYLLWGNALTMAGILLALWLNFFPRPHEFLVLANAAVPLLSMGVIWKTKVKNSYSLTEAAIFIPCAGLLWDTLSYNYFSFPDIFRPAAFISLCLAVIFIVFLEDLITAAKARLYLLAVAAALGFTYTVSLNCALDNSAPETFKMKVEDKRVSSGKYSDYYYLSLDRSYRWMPDSNVQVHEGIYDRLNVNDEVCLYRRKGLLHIPWYTPGLCEGTEAY
jgi:hypothetical protein